MQLARELWGRLVTAALGTGFEESDELFMLVGNPPWLSYRFMPAEIQRTFRTLATERGPLAGAEVATHQDLSGLFVARAWRTLSEARRALCLRDARGDALPAPVQGLSHG